MNFWTWSAESDAQIWQLSNHLSCDMAQTNKLPKGHLSCDMAQTNKLPKGQRSLTWDQCAKVKSHLKKTTYKWAMETRGPKSKLVPAFIAVLVPATLMMNQSKLNALAWRHHFPIISLWEMFYTSRAANSVVSGPIWQKFKLARNVMHVLITCKYKKDRIKKQPRKGEDISFPIISQWGLSVDNLPQNLRQPFPTPNDATHKIWLIQANWLQRYLSSKV